MCAATPLRIYPPSCSSAEEEVHGLLTALDYVCVTDAKSFGILAEGALGRSEGRNAAHPQPSPPIL